MIPKQFQKKEFNFVLIQKKKKKPFQKNWQKKEVKYDSEELIQHIKNGGNYGIRTGGNKNLIVIDFDNKKIQDEISKKLPETLTIKTGSGMLHKYFYSDKCENLKIFDEKMNTLVDIQGERKQVIAPNSIHPNGKKYEIIDNKDIKFIPFAEVKAYLIPYDKKPKKQIEKEQRKESKINDDFEFIDTLKRKINIKDVLDWIGIDTSKNPTECPFHDSRKGKCLGWGLDVAHCFHCDDSWNIISLIKDYKKVNSKEAIKILAEMSGLEKEYEEARKKYFEKLKEQRKDKQKDTLHKFLELTTGKEKKWARATEILRDYILNNNFIYTTKNDQKTEMWIYKGGIYVPDGKSEVKKILRDLLQDWYSAYVFNLVLNKLEPDTFIDEEEFFKNDNFEEVAIQNGILNIFTKELSDFTPKKIFFNKLNAKYNPKQECPKIDKFFSEILSNEEDRKVIYEMIGYCLLKDSRFEKAFMFIGDGRNGKDKTLELIKRLFSIDNCSAVTLHSLENDDWAVFECFKKMINIAGEISNEGLKNAQNFKAMTGRSLMDGKRKFLNSIKFINYAKFIFACNELPMVYEHTRAFWERWILLEFPYTFVTEKELRENPNDKTLKLKDANIIEKITSSNELSGLLNKSLDGLHRLLGQKEFSNTKGSKEIKDMWIRKANSFMAFCMDMIEENYDSYITKKDLRREYNKYCKKHKVKGTSDKAIKSTLQDLFGVTEEYKSFDIIGQKWVWMGINLKKNK